MQKVPEVWLLVQVFCSRNYLLCFIQIHLYVKKEKKQVPVTLPTPALPLLNFKPFNYFFFFFFPSGNIPLALVICHIIFILVVL